MWRADPNTGHNQVRKTVCFSIHYLLPVCYELLPIVSPTSSVYPFNKPPYQPFDILMIHHLVVLMDFESLSVTFSVNIDFKIQ